jgi:uncharacterized membrane protein YqiK
MASPILTFLGVFLSALFGIYILSRFFVNVGAKELAVTERQFFGSTLAPGRIFAMGAEVGMRAAYLSPGLHFVLWPFTRVVYKQPFLLIAADELGIVEATDGAALPSDRIFADDTAGATHNNFQEPMMFLKNGGIRGKQLRFLTSGVFKIHPSLFKVTKIKKTSIPEGSIGVVTALDGAPLKGLLARNADGHDNFQKAEAFLKNGGQKGPQIDFLRPGTYNINTEIFKVEVRDAVKISESEIGVVEAKDGLQMDAHDVVVQTPDGHNNFQDGQKFLDNGGKRGPQEAILTPGMYYINPYLFSVSKNKQTMVKQGEVGVLISNIGKDPSDFMGADAAEDASDDKGRTRHVVPKGFRGIQSEVLGPGAYNINPLAYSVIIIPTVTRSVEWSAEADTKTGSASFDPFQVVSNDGFPMQVEVRCQYRILPENAPFVVQKIGSIAQLESNVLHPQIDGIFRAQVAHSPAIAYQQNRSEEQKAAEEAVRADLVRYRVDVVSVMVTNIHLPEALMQTTQQKNLAEQEKSMYDSKQQAEQRRIEYEKTRTEADSQAKIISAQTGIQVAQYEAKQTEERARGDAARVRMLAEAQAAQTQQVGDAEAAIIQAKGEAQAKAYQDQVNALTAQGVMTVEVIKAISAAGLKITPDIQVASLSGATNEGGNGGLVQALLAKMLQQDKGGKVA